MAKVAAFFVLIFMCLGQLSAQDTLPKFTVTTKGNNRILVSWTNAYPSISQISIQRSYDSTKNFKTILTVPDPTNLQNGFVDTKAPTWFMFYRIFIVLDSGKYVFSPSKRPFWDTAKSAVKPVVKPTEANGNGAKRVIISDTLNKKEADKIRERLNEPKPVDTVKVVEKIEPERFFTVKRRDTIVAVISEKNFKAFRDSIVYKTKDTMVFRSIDTIVVKPFVPKEVFKPSIYVYTVKEGNVSISLPDASVKHYAVKFFDEKNNPIFEINKVKESPLILDKANFLRSGWFRFELYEDGKLKEKNKFFIPKDF